MNTSVLNRKHSTENSSKIYVLILTRMKSLLGVCWNTNNLLLCSIRGASTHGVANKATPAGCLNFHRMHMATQSMLDEASLAMRRDKAEVPRIKNPQRLPSPLHATKTGGDDYGRSATSPAARKTPAALFLVRGSSREQSARRDAVGGAVREPECRGAPRAGAAARRWTRQRDAEGQEAVTNPRARRKLRGGQRRGRQARRRRRRRQPRGWRSRPRPNQRRRRMRRSSPRRRPVRGWWRPQRPRGSEMAGAAARWRRLGRAPPTATSGALWSQGLRQARQRLPVADGPRWRPPRGTSPGPMAVAREAQRGSERALSCRGIA